MIMPGLNLERQAEALSKAQKHWEGERTTARPWLIALTREAGAAGAEVAREIGARLHWPVYDRELIERIAREMGLRSHLLESLDERHRSWLIEAAHSFTLAGPVSEGKFLKQLIETLLSLSTIGHCVIVGRGGAQILPAESTLRVRLVAAKEDRVSAAQRTLKLSHADAQRWVDETDQARTRFIKDHFSRDPNDPTRYDLVLNTSRWTVTECADLVIDALKRLEARKGSSV
jgi:cytidylate kinase